MKHFFEQFPEGWWICNDSQYQKDVLSGYMLSARKEILIVGLARDCEEALLYNIYRLEKLGSLFYKYRIMVVENDSKDRTAQTLQEWEKRNPRVNVLSFSNQKERHKQNHSLERRKDMAEYRNKYLDFVESTRTEEYVAVFDFDMIGGFSYDGIMHSVKHLQRRDVDVIGSNSLLYQNEQRLYYDTWAFRKMNWDVIDVGLMRVERGEPLMEVLSVGGGLILYKNRIQDYRYTEDDCDHPTLHRQMKRRGQRIWLNPSQITLFSKHFYCL